MRKLVLLACVLALAGCDDTLNTTNDKRITNIRNTLNAKEFEMLDNYIIHTSRSLHLYNDMYYALARRNHYNDDAASKRSDDEIPFCDVIESVIEAEDNIRSTYEWTMTNQWRSEFGYTLAESCGYEHTTDKITENEVVSIVAAAKEQEQNEVDLLSHTEYDYLIEAAMTCERSKNEIMKMTEYGRLLTVSDGEKARRTILECKREQLEKSLNE